MAGKQLMDKILTESAVNKSIKRRYLQKKAMDEILRLPGVAVEEFSLALAQVPILTAADSLTSERASAAWLESENQNTPYREHPGPERRLKADWGPEHGFVVAITRPADSPPSSPPKKG